jgi:hypothetical protein
MLTALGATETEDSVYCFVATTVSATGAEIGSATAHIDLRKPIAAGRRRRAEIQ